MSEIITNAPEILTRRSLLTKGFKAAATFGLGAMALNLKGDLNPFVVIAMNDLSAGDLNFAGDDICVLTSQTTEGPCYYNANLVRRNITEGITGMPVRLAYRVVNVDTCQPIPNASVEIWHTDRNGNYSAPITNMCTSDTTTRTQTFGRGIQLTDARLGLFRFDLSGLVFGTRHAHTSARQDQRDDDRYVAVLFLGQGFRSDLSQSSALRASPEPRHDEHDRQRHRRTAFAFDSLHYEHEARQQPIYAGGQNHRRPHDRDEL